MQINVSYLTLITIDKSYFIRSQSELAAMNMPPAITRPVDNDNESFFINNNKLRKTNII